MEEAGGGGEKGGGGGGGALPHPATGNLSLEANTKIQNTTVMFRPPQAS